MALSAKMKQMSPHSYSTISLIFLQVKEAVKYALSAGYHHIDCAPAYSNEGEIGDALQEMVGNDKVKKKEWEYCCCKKAGWVEVSCLFQIGSA